MTMPNPKTRQHLSIGAMLALGFHLTFLCWLVVPRARAQDNRSSAEVLKETEHVLSELFRQISAAHRSPNEESIGEVRSAAARLNGIVELLQKHIAEHKESEEAPLLRERLESLRQYIMLENPTGERTLLLTAEVDTRARIIFKPEPGFTEDARQANVSGRVRLLAVLALDGRVKYVVSAESLAHGLTEQAIDAARRIRFEPALKQGRAVSQVVLLEYNFNI
jgi:TonB family protein